MGAGASSCDNPGQKDAPSEEKEVQVVSAFANEGKYVVRRYADQEMVINESARQFGVLARQIMEDVNLALKVFNDDKPESDRLIIDNIEMVYQQRIDVWTDVFEAVEASRVKSIMAIVNEIIKSSIPEINKIVMESSTKRWSGSDLVGFRGKVVTIDLTTVSKMPLFVNMIFASSLAQIKRKYEAENEKDGMFFCIRIDDKQEAKKVDILRDFYEVVSGKQLDLSLNQHLPEMAIPGQFEKYYLGSLTISKITQ